MSCKIKIDMDWKELGMQGIKGFFSLAMKILISVVVSPGLLKIMLDILYGIGFAQEGIVKNSSAESWQPYWKNYKWFKGIICLLIF